MEHVCHWKPPVPHDCNDFISKPQPQTERVDNLRLMVTEILTSVATRETTMARVSAVVSWQDSLSVDSSDPAITGLELQTVSLRASCLPCDGSQLWLPGEDPVHRGQQSGGVRHLNWRHLWDSQTGTTMAAAM